MSKVRPETESPRLMYRMSQKHLDDIRAAAEAHGVKVSSVLRTATEFYLESLQNGTAPAPQDLRLGPNALKRDEMRYKVKESRPAVSSSAARNPAA